MELLTAMPVSICLLDCSELEIRRMELRCVSFVFDCGFDCLE